MIKSTVVLYSPPKRVCVPAWPARLRRSRGRTRTPSTAAGQQRDRFGRFAPRGSRKGSSAPRATGSRTDVAYLVSSRDPANQALMTNREPEGAPRPRRASAPATARQSGTAPPAHRPNDPSSWRRGPPVSSHQVTERPEDSRCRLPRERTDSCISSTYGEHELVGAPRLEPQPSKPEQPRRPRSFKPPSRDCWRAHRAPRATDSGANVAYLVSDKTLHIKDLQSISQVPRP